VTLLNAD
jgi:hypothetical protein